MILNTFLCEAEGKLEKFTDESQNIRWEKISYVKKIIKDNPDSFFLMHVNALKKYLELI